MLGMLSLTFAIDSLVDVFKWMLAQNRFLAVFIAGAVGTAVIWAFLALLAQVIQRLVKHHKMALFFFSVIAIGGALSVIIWY